ncbi:MAG: ABC transporter ATP-binding protein [Pirellulales bacterium]
MSAAAVDLREVSFAYGERTALDGLTLRIEAGEVFGLLGPNGGGKSTLFRLLATLVPLQSGEVQILGCDLRRQAAQIREHLGVVFQSSSVDRQLTVAENLACSGALFGLRGAALRRACDEVLDEMGLTSRVRDRAATLSGGLRRRLELAQSLLHRPPLLLLDEPSTGLDPGARLDLWQALQRLRTAHGTTIVLTTHLLEEAEKADRLGLLDAGRLVALDTPAALRSTVGGDTVTIETPDPVTLGAELRERFQLPTQLVEGRLRFESAEGTAWIARIAATFPERITSLTLGKPTLEDVFVARTGRRLQSDSRSGERQP